MCDNKQIEEGFFIKTADNKDIYVYCWNQVTKPKGVLQIFHGMVEHSARYREFAKFLNEHNYIVYSNDHRGHGKTADNTDELGYIGEDGFNKIVEDEYQITKLIQKKHSGFPITILGHSFGSFIAQEYIIRYGNQINGVILSGSAVRTGADVFAGKVLSSIGKYIFGERKKAHFINYLAFYNYNKGIQNCKSKNQWLSSDENEVKKYDEDQFCGVICSIGFYYNFFRGISNLYKNERLAKIPKGLPIFIVSGKQDPVGKYGELVRKLYNIYIRLGIRNVKLKLYENRRHELLNELDKHEVYNEILEWVNKTS